MQKIPEKIFCEAFLNGSAVSGVMLQANLGMSRKNQYSFIFGPTDSNGHAVINRNKILKEAKSQLELALMDYDPIEAGFSGEITVNAMSEKDLRRAIEAFQLYKSVFGFPDTYIIDLEQAAESSISKQAESIKVIIS